MFSKFSLSPYYMIRWQANNDGGNSGEQNNQNQNTNNQNQNQETFEAWLSSQPDEIKTKVTPLFTAHVEKLHNTVKATRQERDEFSKQLRDAIKKLDSNSDEHKRLTELANQSEEANKRADFYEQAPQYECRNPKAAYAIAKSQDLFSKSGLPDWKAIQAEAPELFGKVTPKAPKKSAGNGTGDEPTKQGGGMNDWIRQQAGVSTTQE